MSAPVNSVLLLCWRDTGHPQGGGSETYLQRIGTHLAQSGVRVTLRTARYPGAARREVVDGVDVASSRRPGASERDLARGPGRLTKALGLTGEDNGAGMVGRGAPFALVAPEHALDPALVSTGPRVGVSGPGGDGDAYPWRFSIAGEPTVSAYRPGRPRVRRG